MAAAPKKRFGQNFLHDAGVVRRIIHAVRPQANDRIVEIGPGRGALTQGLIEGAGHLTAIELDRDLVEPLAQRFGDRLRLISQDVLTVDFRSLALELGAPIRIVGNLPYNISSPILFHLLPCADLIRDQTFMLQKEVVDRMVASEGSKTYGRLSVMLQARYVMERLFVVPPGAFTPAPAVDSAIVAMYPLAREEVRVKNWAMLEAVVTAAFATRRKMLRNTLSDYLSRIDLSALGVRETDRAEDVPVSAYVEMANQVLARGRPQKG
ncbi:MAG: 16S rRNA (adenine(1518)-N(6)/adenine(1519)-N(6))-dimethyltransferase RsmA [Betaproteobacteria bacterium]|nr:16S rRNA (adenine(1518)-N(6)/adenine(1519)-N(6))-dimethyltransferase RsmA [Betaproteobacteria bacterium]